jgi:plasmid maintenance system killer protein
VGSSSKERPTVTGNWRLIFRYDERTNTASDIDLMDYH